MFEVTKNEGYIVVFGMGYWSSKDSFRLGTLYRILVFHLIFSPCCYQN
jgi:hypothetical protein